MDLVSLSIEVESFLFSVLDNTSHIVQIICKSSLTLRESIIELLFLSFNETLSGDKLIFLPKFEENRLHFIKNNDNTRVSVLDNLLIIIRSIGESYPFIKENHLDILLCGLDNKDIFGRILDCIDVFIICRTTYHYRIIMALIYMPFIHGSSIKIYDNVVAKLIGRHYRGINQMVQLFVSERFFTYSNFYPTLELPQFLDVFYRIICDQLINSPINKTTFCKHSLAHFCDYHNIIGFRNMCKVLCQDCSYFRSALVKLFRECDNMCKISISLIIPDLRIQIEDLNEWIYIDPTFNTLNQEQIKEMVSSFIIGKFAPGKHTLLLLWKAYFQELGEIIPYINEGMAFQILVECPNTINNDNISLFLNTFGDSSDVNLSSLILLRSLKLDSSLVTGIQQKISSSLSIVQYYESPVFCQLICKVSKSQLSIRQFVNRGVINHLILNYCLESIFILLKSVVYRFRVFERILLLLNSSIINEYQKAYSVFIRIPILEDLIYLYRYRFSLAMYEFLHNHPNDYSQIMCFIPNISSSYFFMPDIIAKVLSVPNECMEDIDNIILEMNNSLNLGYQKSDIDICRKYFLSENAISILKSLIIHFSDSMFIEGLQMFSIYSENSDIDIKSMILPYIYPSLLLIISHDMSEKENVLTNLEYLDISFSDLVFDGFPYIRAEYTAILHSSNFYCKKAVVQALHYIVKNYEKVALKYSEMLFDMIEMAFDIPKLGNKCARILEQILQYPLGKEAFSNSFSLVIVKALQSGQIKTDLFLSEISCDVFYCPDTLAYLSSLLCNNGICNQRIEQLVQEKSNIKTNFSNSIVMLTSIQKYSFKKFILEQLVIYCKSNPSSLIDFPGYDIIHDWLWNSFFDAESSIIESLSIKCLSLLPIKANPTNQPLKTAINKERTLLLSLLSGFLKKMLYQPSSMGFSIKIGIAIQQTIRNLLEYDPHNTIINDPDFEPYKIVSNMKNIYLHFDIPKESPYLANFVEKLINCMEKCNIDQVKLFKPFKPLLCESEALCEFLFPYIIYFCRDNQDLMNCVISEWKEKYELFQSSPVTNNEITQAIRSFLSAFYSLSSFMIYIGCEFPVPNWQTLRIASEKELYLAAFKCGLFELCLFHYEIDSDRNTLDIHDRLVLFEHLNDQDCADYLKSEIELNEILTNSNASQSQYSNVRELISKRDFPSILSIYPILISNSENNCFIKASITRAALALGKWNIIPLVEIPSSPSIVENDLIGFFELKLSHVVFLLRNKDFDRANLYIDETRDIVTASTFKQVHENSASLENTIVLLKYLNEVENHIESFRTGKPISNKNYFTFDSSYSMSINQLEMFVIIRTSIIETQMAMFNGNQDLLSLLQTEYLNLSRSFRKRNFTNQAELYINFYKQQSSLSSSKYLIDVAKIKWMKNEYQTAFSILKHLMKNNPSYSVYKYLAKWGSEISFFGTNEIKNFYQKTFEFSNSPKSYYCFGSYLDNSLWSYIQIYKSGSITIKTEDKMKPPQNFIESICDQLVEILDNYFISISKAATYSTVIIPRILYYIFDFKSTLNQLSPLNCEDNSMIQAIISYTLMKHLFAVPSYIWVNSITQIVSRAQHYEDSSSIVLTILQKCADSAPKLSLWHLMFLYNTQIDYMRDVFNKISFNNDEKLVNSYKEFTALIIRLSTLKSLDMNIFSNSRILVPNIENMIAPYSESNSTIEEIGKNPLALNTKTKPIKIKIKDNTGKKTYFLVRGSSDQRRDMRMMEFCSYINRLMHDDKRSRDRNLSLKLFYVVCLSPKYSIVEWVRYTEQLGKFKEVFYNLNWNSLKKTLEDSKDKVNDYQNKVLPKIPKVFHLWFASLFHNPSKWLSSRTLYIQSTAIWSMIGYIIGLGDRHMKNILINIKNGSVIHIDFEIIFGLGSKLPKPETVPFRLTTNVIDGFGHLGTKGSFTNVSVLFLNLLRENYRDILSVLNAFVHDKLIGSHLDNQISIDTVLDDVEKRIRGISEDRTSILSSEYTVDHLISQATSPSNLGVMFIGWMPYV